MRRPDGSLLISPDDSLFAVMLADRWRGDDPSAAHALPGPTGFRVVRNHICGRP